MSRLTKDDVNSDISFLMDAISSKGGDIPSIGCVLLISLFVPLVTFLLSCLNSVVYYFSSRVMEHLYSGFFDYMLSEGWVFIGPSVVIGFVFFIMAYLKALTYLAIPKDARENSIVISRLKKIASRTVFSFLFLMIFMSIALPIFNLSIYAVPALEFILLFAVNILLGLEISRLGIGYSLGKCTSLLNKI